MVTCKIYDREASAQTNKSQINRYEPDSIPQPEGLQHDALTIAPPGCAPRTDGDCSIINGFQGQHLLFPKMCQSSIETITTKDCWHFQFLNIYITFLVNS